MKGIGMPGQGEWRDTDHHLRIVARKVLSSRAAFRRVLPPNTTYDPELETLLVLFIADNFRIAADEIIDVVKQFRGSARWVAALEAKGLVTSTDDVVALSAAGQSAMRDALELVIDAQMQVQ